MRRRSRLALEPLPLYQRKHRQGLAVRHRGDRDVVVELEGAAHARAEGGVLELAVRADLGDDAGEGEGGGLEVDG